MAAGDQRPPLGRAHPFDHQEDTDDGQGGRTDDDETEAGHGGPKPDPPQWSAHPMATSTAATATMENAGR